MIFLSICYYVDLPQPPPPAMTRPRPLLTRPRAGRAPATARGLAAQRVQCTAIKLLASAAAFSAEGHKRGAPEAGGGNPSGSLAPAATQGRTPSPRQSSRVPAVVAAQRSPRSRTRAHGRSAGRRRGGPRLLRGGKRQTCPPYRRRGACRRRDGCRPFDT